MKKLFFTMIISMACALPLFVSAAPILIPFGGSVTAITVCDSGILALVLQPPTPKQPNPVPKPFMWLIGELPFLSYKPPFIGQNLVGEASSVLSPCVIGNVPYGFGLPIDFHGSSLLGL